MNINDRMRISDSDRDQAAAQLRDYYAEGRLTDEELDERVTAALNARTAGDLRRVMADLRSPGLTCRRMRPRRGDSAGAAGRGCCPGAVAPVRRDPAARRLGLLRAGE